MNDLRVGVDLGGTKIEAIVVELGEPPNVVARERVATSRELGYDHVVATTAALVRTVVEHAGLTSMPPIGLGMPGSVTSKRVDGSISDIPLVKNSNTVCLNGRPFRSDLSRALGSEIAFANDANCFALAEAKWGAARDARITFGVILGTGVGGGIVFRNGNDLRTWDGTQGIAGEWGHVVLDPTHGPPCYCGKRGCVETFLSGPAIEATFFERIGIARTAADIFSSTEDAATALVAERIDIFGRAIATVIDILDPDVVVLGGGLSNADALYTAGIRAAARWVFNDSLTTRIVKHELGDSAGVLGAALLPG